MSWVDALVLRSDEKVIDSWEGTREIIQKVDEGPTQQGKKSQNKMLIKGQVDGLLVLTNQRLLFLEGLGSDGKWMDKSVKVALIDVDKLWFEKAPIKPIDTVDGLETHVFSLKKVGKKKDFEAFKKLVEEHCRKRREEFEKAKKKTIHFKIG